MKKKYILYFFIFVIIILLLFIIGILSVQSDAFFHPWHDEDSYNYLLGNKEFEEVRIDNNGKLIDGWFKYNVDETIVLDDVTHGYYFSQDNVLERIKEYLQERL